MTQTQILLDKGGDDWFRRNKDRLGTKDDPVERVIEDAGLKPRSVLEVGCANGWRLKRLHDKYGCKIAGVDPSAVAIENAGLLYVMRATADRLPFYDSMFDLVIMGFCLYLIPPEEMLRAVSESDRVLKDGGHLIIYDFAPSKPFKRHYVHMDGIFSYHFHQPALWLSHPGYKIAGETSFPPGHDTATLLHKDFANAFPLAEDAA